MRFDYYFDLDLTNWSDSDYYQDQEWFEDDYDTDNELYYLYQQKKEPRQKRHVNALCNTYYYSLDNKQCNYRCKEKSFCLSGKSKSSLPHINNPKGLRADGYSEYVRYTFQTHSFSRKMKCQREKGKMKDMQREFSMQCNQ